MDYEAMNFNCRSQDARDALDALRARLASKPSRSEGPELDEKALADTAYGPSGYNPGNEWQNCRDMIEHIAWQYKHDLAPQFIIQAKDEAIASLDLLHKHYAARPSREEAPDLRTALDLLGEIMSYAETWANLPQNLRNRAEAYLHPYDTGEKKTRPSREEEMREQIERIKHDCENALRSSTHHKCDYLSLIQSINDRLARAALAQGGARDEAQEEVKQMLCGRLAAFRQ